jgi:hypothetical protein
MIPEDPDAPTKDAATGCSPLFCIWIAIWLLIPIAVIAHQVHNRPRIIVGDWPNGRSADADHWHGGEFLGHPAKRIRRVATYRGDHVQQHSIHFFATIPMTRDKLQSEIGRWRKLGWFQDAASATPILPEVQNCPDRFPFSSDCHIGTVSEYGVTPSYHLFRRPGDDHIHLWLWK